MTQPSCVSDGESHLRTPHVSSFGAEACAAAASARPTSSHPRAELIIAPPEPTLAGPRAALACCACGPAARVGLVSAGREAPADRPPERPAPGAADPLLARSRNRPRPVAAGTAPTPHPPRDLLGLARASLSTPSPSLIPGARLGRRGRPVARLPVRAAAPPPPRARVTAQQRRRHDDETRQTSSYPRLTALLRRSILRVSRPSPPPSAPARPAPDVARTTRPTAHPPRRRLADLEKVHGAPARHRRLGAPTPRRHRPFAKARARKMHSIRSDPPSEGLIRLR